MPNTIKNTATNTTNKTAAKPAPRKRVAKPAPKAAAKPATDKPDAQALAVRIAGERTTAANIFAQAKTGNVSIPVKPLSAYAKTYKATVTAHAIGRKPSPRQAAALAVCAAANGKAVANDVKLKRTFDINGAPYAIENGALSDAIASGLCSYDSASETITITNAAECAAQAGSKRITI